MKIIAHRGYWKNVEEQNTSSALMKALELGFGVETDVRDYKGKLVVSHDMVINRPFYFEDFLLLYKEKQCNELLALNVKSDGLVEKLHELLVAYEISKYFVFDMSVPDTLSYLKRGLKTYSRISEYERFQDFNNRTEGLWVDELERAWINVDILKNNIFNLTANICIVSPELHSRDHSFLWEQVRVSMKTVKHRLNLMMCTDFPQKAQEFFNE